MVSAILFDFNGVIIDDEPQHRDALITTLAEYGHALDRDTYYAEYLGFDDRECFRFTFRRLGRPTTMGPSPPRSSERISTTSAPSATRCGCARRGRFHRERWLDGFQLAIVSGALRREVELVLDLAACGRISPRSWPRRT